MGQDGLARMWDIREAALKRCRSVRSRIDYTLPKVGNEKDIEVTVDRDAHEMSQRMNGNHSEGNLDVILPPLPASLNNESNQSESGIETSTNSNNASDTTNAAQNGHENTNEISNNNGVFVPPLPAGAEQGVGADDIRNGGNNSGGPAPGAFVANDDIDEGVILLSKLQHGALPANDQLGTSTRAKRKKVNVFCITRCPIGGHFATGSDDGIGRIWADDDDQILENIDDTMREENSPFDGNSLTNLLPSQAKDSLYRTKSSSHGINVGKSLEIISPFNEVISRRLIFLSTFSHSSINNKSVSQITWAS